MSTGIGEAHRDETLGFEDWAALSARLLRRTEVDRARILEEARLTSPDWAKLDARFAKELVADLAEGDMARVQRFAAICAEELASRGVKGPETGPPPPMPAHAAPLVEAFGEPPAEAFGELPAEPLARTNDTGRPPPMRVSEPPAKTHDTGPPPPPMRVSEASAKTHDTGPPPPPMRVSEPPAKTHDTGPPPPPMVHAGSAARTSDTDRPPPTPRFQDYLAGAPPPSGHHDGKTFMTPQYGPPPVDRTPELSVEQYAALCVASAMFPDRALAVLHQFGVIDEAAHRELNEEWRAKMGEDSALQDRWIKLCVHYREHYRKWPGAQT